MKKFWPLLNVAFLVSLIVTFVPLAHASPPPSTVAKQVYKDNAALLTKTYPKARLLSVKCGAAVERTIYPCTIKALDNLGKPKCVVFYIAYRPGYHSMTWRTGWLCGTKKEAIPPIPPKNQYRPLSATFTGPPS